MNYRLSRATEEDADFLIALFHEVRGPEFQLAGLPPQMLEQLLTMQRRAQAMSYAAQFPHALEEIVWIDTSGAEERAGRMLVDTADTDVCLVDIALLERFRGQGIGTQILEQLCATARASRHRLHLSVRAGNPAARLYGRLGFVDVGGDGVHTMMELQDTPTAASPAVPLDEPAGDAPRGYTYAYFRTLVGQRLAACTLEWPGHPASGPIELQVERVVRLVPPPGVVAVDPGDSFTVHLHGNPDELLQPESVELRPPGGEPMIVFITPLGPKEGRMQYEVVFNRTQPKT